MYPRVGQTATISARVPIFYTTDDNVVELVFAAKPGRPISSFPIVAATMAAVKPFDGPESARGGRARRIV